MIFCYLREKKSLLEKHIPLMQQESNNRREKKGKEKVIKKSSGNYLQLLVKQRVKDYLFIEHLLCVTQ